MLREVFLEGEYELPQSLKPKRIIDLGSNIGLSVAFFKLRYPDAEVIALEPDPRAFSLLEVNTAGFAGVYLIPEAVAAAEGETTRLYQTPLTWASSTMDTSQGAPVVDVRTRSLDGILDEFSPDGADVLKIDVEGAEWEVLAASKRLTEVGCIVGEAHLSAIPVPLDQFFSLFGEFDIEIREKGQDVIFRAMRKCQS